MSQKKYTAFVMGSTGATGRALINELVQSPNCGSIVSLTRRPLYGAENSKEKPEKLREVVVKDFDSVLKPIDAAEPTNDTIKQTFSNIDVAFNCLGSTRARAGSAEAFTHFDKDYPLFAAQYLKKYSANTLRQYQLLTSIGSNADSWFLYTKVKGEVEEGIRAMNFPYTSVFRPSILITPQGREIPRFGEAAAQAIAPWLDWMLVGPMRKYRSITVDDVAKSMRVDWERTWLAEEQK